MAIAFVFFAQALRYNWRITLGCVAAFSILFFVIWALTYGFYTILNVIWSMVLGVGGFLSANIFYIIVSMIYLVAIILLPETYHKK